MSHRNYLALWPSQTSGMGTSHSYGHWFFLHSFPQQSLNTNPNMFCLPVLFPPSQPLNVVRTFRTKSKRFVLIKDETIQDGAGAVLLIPSFTHSRDLDKPLIARVVFEAVNRCTPCLLNSWAKRFDGGVFHRFVRLPAVVAMITGDLRREVDKQRGVDEDAEKCYMTEVLWAIITVEVLDYLQYKRRDLPMLTWLTQLPKWLCQHDATTIESEVDAVFEEWKAGRLCGASLGRPCDSECCCHGAITRASCGCQCPCVCNCS